MFGGLFSVRLQQMSRKEISIKCIFRRLAIYLIKIKCRIIGILLIKTAKWNHRSAI